MMSFQKIYSPMQFPKGITPTTHIIKLPIGEIRQPNATLDLSQSVDNEYYCLLLAKELGLNVPDAEIIKAGRVRALAVERFDRRWNTERTVFTSLATGGYVPDIRFTFIGEI
ncbi:regulator with HipB [Escherichia coli]|uniref:Regulator with HipB n=1 Tax=Escherichia coli TaxID=562 RepID=A0A376W373_ECOLX|nr:regulator with HipB [Escherichia coli]